GSASPDAFTLSAKELSSYDLARLRLLTLSACHGATGTLQVLEAPASLATAARAAGAGAVAASLWNVGSDACAKLMIELYGHWQSQGRPGRALADAQRAMRKAGAPASDWAAFAIWADQSEL